MLVRSSLLSGWKALHCGAASVGSGDRRPPLKSPATHCVAAEQDKLLIEPACGIAVICHGPVGPPGPVASSRPAESPAKHCIALVQTTAPSACPGSITRRAHGPPGPAEVRIAPTSSPATHAVSDAQVMLSNAAFEVLVGLAAVVAAIGGGTEK